MKTLFDPAVNAEILDRLKKLDPTARARWGKLSLERMLSHLHLSLLVNFGEVELERGLLGLFFGGISRKILLAERPYPKIVPAHKKTLPTTPAGFLAEKQKVENAVKTFTIKGPEGLCKRPHYVLGNITPEEAAFLSYKHVDHHLRQFGA